MLSFELAGDMSSAKRLVERTKLFRLAVSLGAVESLIEQPATMSHDSYDAAAREKHGIRDSLVRLSVGLEHVDDLREDLEQAITAAG
jgi:cystathionine beta-lyase/cystathionine gamma-synthase